MSIGTIILIILVIALLGGFSGIGGGPFYGTGYYGGGGLGLVIVILLILLLLGQAVSSCIRLQCAGSRQRCESARSGTDPCTIALAASFLIAALIDDAASS